MRAVFLHFGVLCILFWGACTIEIPPADRPALLPTESVADNWRRTANGWEQRSQWSLRATPPPARPGFNVQHVHPLNIALLEALMSIGVLLLGSPLPPSYVRESA